MYQFTTTEPLKDEVRYQSVLHVQYTWSFYQVAIYV
jgi:hypothetical protein